MKANSFYANTLNLLMQSRREALGYGAMNPEPQRGDIERPAKLESMSPFQGFDY